MSNRIFLTTIAILGVLFASHRAKADSNFEIVRQLPYGSGVVLPTALIAVDSKLYGTSFGGGSVYTLNPDGTEFQLLHQFTLQGHSYPLGKLSTDGARLYGTTSDVGSHETSEVTGSIYSVNFDGSDFQFLHAFDDQSGDTPRSGVTIVGSKMFGTTSSGGVSGSGTIYSANLDGSGFQTLHSFGTTAPDLINSNSAITWIDSKLYGTMSSGGDSGKGILYSMNPDGSEFQIIHQFDGISGSEPSTQLLFDGVNIFGTTIRGGTLNYGTVFSIRPDGSNYEVLHQFSGAAMYDPLDGAYPMGDLILLGNTLYGTNIGYIPNGSLNLTGTIDLVPTLPSGLNSTVFSLDRDGTDFEVLHQFYFNLGGGSTNAGLVTIGNKLYGTNIQIAQNPAIFSITVPEWNGAALAGLGLGLLSIGRFCSRRRITAA